MEKVNYGKTSSLLSQSLKNKTILMYRPVMTFILSVQLTEKNVHSLMHAHKTDNQSFIVNDTLYNCCWENFNNVKFPSNYIWIGYHFISYFNADKMIFVLARVKGQGHTMSQSSRGLGLGLGIGLTLVPVNTHTCTASEM